MTEQNRYQFHVIEGTVLTERTNKDLHHDIGSINFYTTKTQEFWLQQTNGKEIHINLKTTLPLRPGHEIVMVNFENYKMPCCLYVKNTDETYAIWNPTEKQSASGCWTFLVIIVEIILLLWLYWGVAQELQRHELTEEGIKFIATRLAIILPISLIPIIISKSNNRKKKENEKFWHEARAALQRHLRGRHKEEEPDF